MFGISNKIIFYDVINRENYIQVIFIFLFSLLLGAQELGIAVYI